MPKLRSRIIPSSCAVAALFLASLVAVPGAGAATTHRGLTHHTTRARVSRCHSGRGPVAIAALSASGPCRGASTPRVRAPHVRLVHRTLRWSALPGVTTYKVAIVRRIGRRRRVGYRVRAATFFRPRAVPGRRMRYRVAANVPHARWTRTVSIKWPRRRAVTASKKPKKPTSTTTSPPTASSPTTTSGGRSAPLRVGVVNTTGWGVDALFKAAGVTSTRLDVGGGSNLSLVQKAVDDGIKPIVLYNPGSGGGHAGGLGGVSPATAAAQVKSIAQRILPLGLNEIEFGNEVYYAESPQTYAAQYAAAHAAVAGMGVKLLAVATAVQSGAAGYGSPTWINQFIAALPDGAAEVDAWTIHPYGPMNGLDSGSWGWESVVDWHNIAVAAGSQAPWYITEVGQCLGGNDCNVPVSQSTQASDVTTYLSDSLNYPWVAMVTWYTCRDDSLARYGLLNDDNSPRPAFTALQSWLAANAASVNG